MGIDPTSTSDRELIQQSLAGSSRSFEELIRRYATRGYGVAYAIVRDESCADDAYQDACIRCYRSLGQFDLERPFFPWFKRIVTNSALTQVARLRHSEVSIDRLKVRDRRAFPFVSDDHEDNDYTSLRAAWNQLSDIDQRVLVSTVFEDNSSKDAGEILGMSAGMVRVQKYRALLRLKRLYDAEA